MASQAVARQAVTESTPHKCPRCGSARVRRSHRRGWLEHALRALGASVRRCHDCRRRWAWIGSRAIPLRQSEKLVAAWGGVLVMSFGLAVCLLAVWWMVVRLGDLSH